MKSLNISELLVSCLILFVLVWIGVSLFGQPSPLFALGTLVALFIASLLWKLVNAAAGIATYKLFSKRRVRDVVVMLRKTNMPPIDKDFIVGGEVSSFFDLNEYIAEALRNDNLSKDARANSNLLAGELSYLRSNGKFLRLYFFSQTLTKALGEHSVSLEQGQL